MAVLNKRQHTIPSNARYCGRGSDWGNRFVIGQDGDRNAVCDKHEADLANRPDLLRRLVNGELRGLDLVCFCAPARCHCDLLSTLSNGTREAMEAWYRNAKAKQDKTPR